MREDKKIPYELQFDSLKSAKVHENISRALTLQWLFGGKT